MEPNDGQLKSIRFTWVFNFSPLENCSVDAGALVNYWTTYSTLHQTGQGDAQLVHFGDLELKEEEGS